MADRKTSTAALLGLLALAASVLGACAPVSVGPAAPAAMPVMAWDHVPGSEAWTDASLASLQAEGAVLLSLVPDDINAWCPAYPAAGPDQRAAFWTGMLSALARHESTWNPRAVGGGGLWFGLVQISPGTARGYGCDVTSGSALQDGVENLQCAIRIAARTVPRDGVVAAGGGLAADWGPFHSATKRAQMREWVASQSYCQTAPAAP